MHDRSELREAALASTLAGATILVCAGVVLMTAACGISVSAQDFPVLKLAGPNDNAARK
jgi:hypothetical protein